MVSRAATFGPASGPLHGTIRVPSDKSITHRALMVAAVCEGRTVVRHPLWSDDTVSTARCLRAAGVSLEPLASDAAREPTDALVQGVGLDGLTAPSSHLDAGNSGTTLRLLAGLFAGGRGRFVLDGDASLRGRPMDRIVAPLRRMGVEVSARDDRFAPVAVTGGAPLPTRYVLPVASAQVKSCVMLAGLHAHGVTEVVEPAPTRDHTERMLAAAGAVVRRDGDTVAVHGRPRLRLDEVVVPGDPSSAAFFAAAAALVPGSSITIRGVGLNETRTGFFEVLRAMGGDVDWRAGGRDVEPAGDVCIGWAPLHGVAVAADQVPTLIDEVPLVALLGTAAEGDTIVEGVGELRVKESDRLQAVADLVGDLGGRVRVGADTLSVCRGRLRGGVVRARGDHRIAMLGAVAGLVSTDGVRVEGVEAAAVSFPGFVELLEEVQAA